MGTGPERVGLGPAGMCGFLTLGRKNFTTRVQVILFVKTGDSEMKEVLKIEEASAGLLWIPRNIIGKT